MASPLCWSRFLPATHCAATRDNPGMTIAARALARRDGHALANTRLVTRGCNMLHPGQPDRRVAPAQSAGRRVGACAT
jgi:hypothetical protein